MMTTATTVRVPTMWKVREPRSGSFRIPFMQRCVVQGRREASAAGLICDLSATGAYVRLDPIPAPCDHLRVSFNLFAGEERPIAVEAVVMWRNDPARPRVPELPPGCGLGFIGLEPADRARLESLVKAYTTTS